MVIEGKSFYFWLVTLRWMLMLVSGKYLMLVLVAPVNCLINAACSLGACSENVEWNVMAPCILLVD